MSTFNLQDRLSALMTTATTAGATDGVNAEYADTYPIENELEVEEMSVRQMEEKLDGAIEVIVENTSGIAQSPEAYDVFQSLLKHYTKLNGSLLTKLLDSICSALQTEVETTARELQEGDASGDFESPQAHKEPLEMYGFLLQWFVQVADKLSNSTRGTTLGEENAAAAASGAASLAAAGGKNARKGRTAKTKSGGAGGTNSSAATSWVWSDHIPLALTTMHKVLRLRTERIWTTTQEKEVFVNCFTRPAYQIAETEAHLKNQEIRLGFYKVICLAVKFHGHTFGAQTSILQNLTYYEHLSEPMAEMLTILENEFDHTQLTEEILREISTKEFISQDAKGPRSFSRFLVKLAELSPRVILKQMSLLLRHLESEAYPMRIAMIEVIGYLIREISISDEGDEEQKNKQIKSFFELLTERYLDLSSWVRGKVLQTIIKLMDLPNKFPKQRHQITELTIRSLEDKTSIVRKYSIQLLCKLIETHPFGGIHGGTLNLPEWEGRYKAIAEQLEAVDLKELEQAKRDAGEEGEAEEQTGSQSAVDAVSRRSQAPNMEAIAREQQTAALDSQTIMRLRLTKKYYVDALRFIHQIESAVPVITQLLTSTTKAEVLESIKFFRLVYEYNLESAEVGIKKMIHLIWTKDNNSTVEDGQETRGVRSVLIETYRSLYFDVVPDLNAKQQVSRIAKNMIERTYGATLAELTSLEELMRAMMADGNGVHPDVINKLWQVYSTETEIPKAQRRGAIIVLGMLALAKKEVVTERVDSLLKIGLGPLGKSDLVLARYSCIALQRLAGSAKKIKGAAGDKSMRLPMDSQIFDKLQQMVEMESRSRQWFSMAEQAINTIYLLGEQPDVLCTAIIQNLSRRVFYPTPTTGNNSSRSHASADMEDVEEATPAPSVGKPSSFQMSQLLFVVGHVAVKHIVYLELVEREFKRQKSENAKAAAANKPQDKDGNDLDAVAGNAEDDIGDLIAEIKEKELLYGDRSLLAVYGPLIAQVCASSLKTYKSPILRQSAVLALAKLMMVSSQFCEAHLALLFRILETSKDPIIRSNIVIALGDIAVCFGSLIDENSDHLYQGLGDRDLVVKKNTLMVLTHLILNGMIKVKGQLGEMAKCLEDDEQRIADLAKLFFKELSTKDNALYNNLQDVISHLSVGSHAVDEETFEKTMKYIFTFIEKEKQAEAIVDKLCQRFRVSTDERQWRDIAFCLSLLPFKSEKSLKKLIEGLPFYRDKLHEETVFKRFNEILTKARSNKTAGKSDGEIKEFEDILAENKAKGAEENALEAEAQRKAARAKKRATTATKTSSSAPKEAPVARPRRGTRRKIVEESDEEEDEDDAQSEVEDEFDE